MIAQEAKVDLARWMSALPDDLPISEINIPGSHNAAAINTKRTTHWTCQDHSITAQLEKGIRLLDIRLKPKKHRHPRTYEFVTCHGHLGPFGTNEFQPFDKVLEECTAFLKTNPGETIIMTIQIDDWRRTKKQDHPEILRSLQTQLSRLPLLLIPHIPTLKESRGRIFLINRLNDDPALGTPIQIPDNTPGETLTSTPNRRYEVHIQDQYKGLNKRHPEAHKFHLTIEAFEKKRPGVMLLNFASATKPFGRRIDIIEDLLNYFSGHAVPDGRPLPDNSTFAAPHRHPIGWLLLDYPFGAHSTSQATLRQNTEDLPTLIIASNPPAS